jgi:hypothetical protein
MDEQVNEYYRYLDAVYEADVGDAMREAEGRWEDSGCSW